MQEQFGKGTMAIAAPIEIDRIMRGVPEGKLHTINEIRTRISAKYGATTTCPLTTGIFAWIAAHVAEEAVAQRAAASTPYWRTLKAGGEINPKYPGGLASVRSRLEGEGHTVDAKGKRLFVADFQAKLFSGRKSRPSKTATRSKSRKTTIKRRPQRIVSPSRSETLQTPCIGQNHGNTYLLWLI